MKQGTYEVVWNIYVLMLPNLFIVKSYTNIELLSVVNCGCCMFDIESSMPMPNAKLQTIYFEAPLEFGIIFELVSENCSSDESFSILISLHCEFLLIRVQNLLSHKSGYLSVLRMKTYTFGASLALAVI